MPQKRKTLSPHIMCTMCTCMTETSIQFKMKRNPRKLKWTKAFRKSAGKEMVVDSTLTFAARRNVPIRYNRDLVATTLRLCNVLVKSGRRGRECSIKRGWRG